MEKMDVSLTEEDLYAMRAFGISREDFAATRQKELELDRRKRFATPAASGGADADGVTPEDLEVADALGVPESAFREQRRKERKPRS